MLTLTDKLVAFHQDEEGATAIEYGLIAAMIAVGILAAVTVFGDNLAGLFNSVADRASNAMTD